MSIINQHDDSSRNTYILNVDSRDRDKVQYPNSNKYGIGLPHGYRAVTQIQLVTAEFECTQYAIDSHNNIIVISVSGVGGPWLQLAVTPGTYTGVNLASALQALLSSAGWTAASVAYDVSTDKLQFGSGAGVGNDILGVIQSQTPGHAAHVPSGLIWDIIGMSQETTQPVTDAATIYTTPERIDLNTDRYLIMEVTHPPAMQGRMRGTGEHHACFAKIIFDNPGSAFNSVYDFVSAPMKLRTLGRLKHLEFVFRRPDGELFDFHHHNHSFTLQITAE